LRGVSGVSTLRAMSFPVPEGPSLEQGLFTLFVLSECVYDCGASRGSLCVVGKKDTSLRGHAWDTKNITFATISKMYFCIRMRFIKQF